MDEIVQEFLVETTENLDQLDRVLVELERNPGSKELLASVFRTIHTIKGATGFLGFERLERLSHVAENLLSRLRDGKLVLTRRRADVLLEVVDAVRGLLRAIETTGGEADSDPSALIDTLTSLLDDEPAEQQAGTAAPAPAPDTAEERAAAEEPAAAPAARRPIRIPPPPPARRRPPAPRQTTQDDPLPPPAEAAAPAPPAESGDAPPPVETAARPTKAGLVPPPAETAAREDERARTGDAHLSASERTVRVDVDVLDLLMRQVGELVLARNQLISHAGQLEHHLLHQTVQHLSLIVSELQEGVMKTRMQPIDRVWARFPRVVRDVAAQFSKQVKLEMEGGETELDRSLLEAVKDPFVHLVRNAVDHGIERPEVRLAAGKPEAGVLSLRAFHEGGQVVLSVSDDGAGIDPARLGARAVERGIVTAERLAQMTPREVTDLIFQPGFSTAAVVTNVSGRGVGMDVVRTSIERIGGTVDVSSVLGQGTTFRIKIPLTLAIIPALLVGCGGQRFAIPQASLLELVRLDPTQAATAIEHINGADFYRLRGRLLPLIRLDALLGQTVERPAGAAVTVMVLQSDDELFGLVVDAVYESQEIVVKPLGRHVMQIPLFAGATILGDGDVALILDVVGLASAAAVRDAGAARATPAATGSATGDDGAAVDEALVILRVGARRRVALPLREVARLEDVGREAIEWAGGRPVLQYRGQLLPLVRLAEALGEEDTDVDPDEPGTARDRRTTPVVVLAIGERPCGLVASEIVDIVEGRFDLRIDRAGGGIVGSAVVQGQVTDLLDTRAAARLAQREELADVS
ncbi:MAG: chemotaxis protein CheA [Actinomycetota bacterium]|nr:chemotaxis protein CheA [Actinomycetota bacterium]